MTRRTWRARAADVAAVALLYALMAGLGVVVGVLALRGVA